MRPGARRHATKAALLSELARAARGGRHRAADEILQRARVHQDAERCRRRAAGRGHVAAELRRACRERYAAEPTEALAAAHDAVRLLVRAARAGDGTAESTRDAMLRLPPLEGATGRIGTDPSGNRSGPVPVAVVRGGRLVPAPEGTERRP